MIVQWVRGISHDGSGFSDCSLGDDSSRFIHASSDDFLCHSFNAFDFPGSASRAVVPPHDTSKDQDTLDHRRVEQLHDIPSNVELLEFSQMVDAF